MRHGKLNREQAIRIVGEDAVNAVDRENCEPTSRLGYNGAMGGNESTEWRAAVDAQDANGDDVRLAAYYYTDNDDDARIAAADGDGGAIDWPEAAGYEVE